MGRQVALLKSICSDLILLLLPLGRMAIALKLAACVTAIGSLYSVPFFALGSVPVSYTHLTLPTT